MRTLRSILDERCSLWRLYLISVGFTLVVAPECNILSLQTSIEVKNGLGAANVFLYSLLCIISLLLYTPLVTLLGRKICLVVGEAPSVLFTLSLLYPTFYTVTPASMLMGIAESIIMPASAAIITEFSSDGIDDRATLAVAKKRNIGIFLTVLALGQTLSSAIPELVLKNSGSTMNDTSTMLNISSCGAYDCPMSYAFAPNATVFNKLVPTQRSLHIFLVLFGVIQVMGIIMQAVFVPDDRPSRSNDRHDNPSETTTLVPSERPSFCHNFKQSLYALKSHVFSFRCLMTLPIQIHYGLFLGFLWSEYTRAYVSCAIGVQHLGICLAITYMFSFVMNFILSKFSDTLPVPVLMIIGYVAETSVILSSLLWVPSSSTEYVSYVLAALFGLAHASRRVTFYVIAGVYFDDLNSAYLIQSGTAAIGLAITYAWCEVLCVYIKIYIMLVHSMVATGLALIAHLRQFGMRI